MTQETIDNYVTKQAKVQSLLRHEMQLNMSQEARGVSFILNVVLNISVYKQ